MAKVNIKSEKITPFGGIYYASKAFYALSLDKVINDTLGVRSSTYNGYRWDEIMSAMSDVFLCGGDCVEDVNRSECYFPGVVSIDGIIAYIENRDGNTPVKFHQTDTLSRVYGKTLSANLRYYEKKFFKKNPSFYIKLLIFRHNRLATKHI